MANRNETNTTSYTHPQEGHLYSLHYAMQYDASGRPIVRTVNSAQTNASSNSAFGEVISVPITPVIQLDALYDLDPREFETFTFGTGTTESTGTLFKTHTGTGAYGYSVIRSRRVIRYRPGQGALTRFTAAFDNPQAGVTLRAGYFNQENAIQIGYNGTQFGVLRATGGKAEIATITITSNTAGTATITLAGVATNVTLSTTNTTTSAKEIAAASFSGWIAEQTDNTVTFLATSLGAKSGAYTVGGTATGTASVVQTGVAQTENWTYQSSFNVDKLDGTGPSGVTIDTTKLNVFQINFRWLGAGEIRYAIEDSDTGDMIFFHHEHFSNLNTDVHTDNPSFKIGYVAYNTTGSTITDSHCFGASMMAAIEGITVETAFPNGTSSDSKGPLTQNTNQHLMSIRNRTTHRGKLNLRLVVLKTLTVSFQGTDPAFVYLYLNPTFSTTHSFAKVGDYSSVTKSITGGTFTLANEQPLAVFALPINGSETFNLDNLHLVLPPSSILSVAIQSGQNISESICALTWAEI